MHRRWQRREHRHVGGARVGRGCDELLELRGVRGRPLREEGRRLARVAVRAEVIGADRIERNEQEIRPPGAGGRGCVKRGIAPDRQGGRMLSGREGLGVEGERAPLAGQPVQGDAAVVPAGLRARGRAERFLEERGAFGAPASGNREAQRPARGGRCEHAHRELQARISGNFDLGCAVVGAAVAGESIGGQVEGDRLATRFGRKRRAPFDHSPSVADIDAGSRGSQRSPPKIRDPNLGSEQEPLGARERISQVDRQRDAAAARHRQRSVIREQRARVAREHETRLIANRRVRK